MKTFQQLQEDIQENLASLALRGVRNVLPTAASAIGALGTVLQARQSKPQMSGDYGQSGETAKPRTPNVQRPSGKVTAAETQRRQAREDAKAAARERAEAKAKQRIDSLIGSDEERAAAAKARAAQPQIQKQLRQQATRDRMNAAANKLGLPEQTTPKEFLELPPGSPSGKRYPLSVHINTKPEIDRSKRLWGALIKSQ